MSAENRKHLIVSLGQALNSVRTLAEQANPIISRYRNKPGVYLSREEVNEALNSRIELLSDEDNPTRNMI